MTVRTHWKVTETPCHPGQAQERWRDAQGRGAAGAVTSWGSGIGHRATLRLFWEADAAGGMSASEAAAAEDLVEEDWTPHWRETLTGFSVSPAIRLDPAWSGAAGAPEGIALVIDPGMAFGAGDHPTTRLMARLLEELAGARGLEGPVLDVGTGTGVLALIAARLGAGRVDALDIDPFCYASCRRNARLNGLSDRVRPLLLSLDLLPGRYPLIAANVVAGQQKALAPHFAAHLAPRGRLALSGFTRDDECAVRGGLPPGLRVERRCEEEGWVALLAGRTGEAHG